MSSIMYADTNLTGFSSNYNTSTNVGIITTNTTITNTTNTTTTPTRHFEESSLLDTQPYLSAFLLSLYVIIFLIGVFGNVMVIYVVVKYRTLQTITNKFIMCLSISDLLLCLLSIPFTPMNALPASWLFGNFMCKLVAMVLAVSVLASTLTSVVIAIDRYLVIVHPHFPRMSHNTQLIINVAIWLISISTSAPIAVFSTELEDENGSKICGEQWPDALSLEVYTWFLLSMQLVLPAITIIVCYTAVSYRLYRRSEVRLGSRIEAKIRMDARRNKRINRMLIAMVAIFISCWLPLHLFHFFTKALPENHVLPVFLVAHIIAMSSVMYNPFLYGWMNENFNLHFRKAMPCLKIRSNSRGLSQMEENSCLTRDTTYLHDQSSDFSLKNSADATFRCKQVNNNKTDANSPTVIEERKFINADRADNSCDEEEEMTELCSIGS